jgi:hypothetical protein
LTKDKKRRRAGAFAPVCAHRLLLIAIIGIFGVSVFFRVATIEVTGAEKYTVQQILTASGLKTGDNIFFIDGDKVSRRIRANLPYLSEVVVEKEMPDTVRITVSESRPLAVVQYEGDWWIIDRWGACSNRRIISDRRKKSRSRPHDRSLGIGETLGVAEDDNEVQYLTDVLRAVQSAGIAGGCRRSTCRYCQYHIRLHRPVHSDLRQRRGRRNKIARNPERAGDAQTRTGAGSTFRTRGMALYPESAV